MNTGQIVEDNGHLRGMEHEGDLGIIDYTTLPKKDVPLTTQYGDGKRSLEKHVESFCNVRSSMNDDVDPDDIHELRMEMGDWGDADDSEVDDG